jgi:proteic killer suppression protein
LEYNETRRAAIKYKVDPDEVKHLFKLKLPKSIIDKIYIWVLKVQMQGLSETRKIPGLHDEQLKDERLVQRSIRLNISYRLIYIEDQENSVVIVKVIEVNKHEY